MSETDKKMEELYKEIDSLKRQNAHERASKNYLREQIQKFEKNKNQNWFENDSDNHGSDSKVDELKDYYE